MKRYLRMICFMVLAVSGGLAQQKKAVPPPPKPADEGPSLEVTMKFIQDKLNDVGLINYAGYYHDNATGSDWTDRFQVQATGVVADPGACRVSFHWKTVRNGTTFADLDVGFSLKAVGDIVVLPADQNQKAIDTAAGHPEWTCRIDPGVFVLNARRTDIKGGNSFDFSDEQMANRVAKAMVHAVELCGGGAKPEPF